jgi:hypothetical protein
MTALPDAMATRNWFLTTTKALERALRQAEFVRPPLRTFYALGHRRPHLPLQDHRTF